MPFLKPDKGLVDWWEYRLGASAGRSNYEVVVYEDDAAEIAVDYVTMGEPKHRYHLYGRREKISDDYGRIHVDHIQKGTPTETDQPENINIQDFEDAIILEYLCITRVPHLQHPHDMLWAAKQYGSAGWNEHFDMFLVVLPFAQETIESLRWMHENPSEDYTSPDIKSVEEVAELLQMLDKCKFERVENKARGNS